MWKVFAVQKHRYVAVGLTQLTLVTLKRYLRQEPNQDDVERQIEESIF